ncbi:MAG: ASKHA domain-containing protein [Anaerolineales bacterium]|nr:ASKHA domain-containing protein [Anaerolineales bacterium]
MTLATHKVRILPSDSTIEAPTGALVAEAIQQAGLEIAQPCGGQGRCGRCAVLVEGGARRRSSLRLTAEDLQTGYALACQTVIEGDLTVTIPEQEKIERRLVTDKAAARVSLPFPYTSDLQGVHAFRLSLPEPNLQDNTDDLMRLQKGLTEAGYPEVEIPLGMIRRMGDALRQSEWTPWVALETRSWSRPNGPPRLLDVRPEPIEPLGLAIDIGTTTVSLHLVNLSSGEVIASAAEYNGQIAFGEDVISRIIYASKNDGLPSLTQRVHQTIGLLLDRLQKRTAVTGDMILKAVVAGNTTMIHLFLGIPPGPIRVAPFIPTVNLPSAFMAGEIGLPINPQAVVDCLPGIASYVGADISAGVLACDLATTDVLTLFIDVGTNGEMVLGTRDWLVTCACSAGPAFEGAGVVDGMRATEGAIEEVWVNSTTYEPTYRVIGGGKPRGICGSGLISLLAELFVTGVVDRAGGVKIDLGSPRVRQGDHGPEYVVAWGAETESGKDIVLTKVDVDNLMRAKAAIYAGFSVLASSVGVSLTAVEQVLVGGSFGKYINVEKAVQIGLLPDVPWERFHFLGNTALQGAYMALLSLDQRQLVAQLARQMTYIELSADNTFYEAFTAAMFLPHTEIARFPSVAEVWDRYTAREPAADGAATP